MKIFWYLRAAGASDDELAKARGDCNICQWRQRFCSGWSGCCFVSRGAVAGLERGSIFKTLDFAKVPVAWVLTFLAITNFERLRRIIFIQSGSVALITAVSVVKGRSHPRLEGVIGGIYSNPNDLAFAIVLSLPFCFAFLLSTRSIPRKIAWAGAMLVMCLGLFMTASRAGFIDLVATGAVCLWYFGVKGKRYHLVAAALLVALVFGVALGGKLKDRFFRHLRGECSQQFGRQCAWLV